MPFCVLQLFMSSLHFLFLSNYVFCFIQPQILITKKKLDTVVSQSGRTACDDSSSRKYNSRFVFREGFNLGR